MRLVFAANTAIGNLKPSYGECPRQSRSVHGDRYVQQPTFLGDTDVSSLGRVPAESAGRRSDGRCERSGTVREWRKRHIHGLGLGGARRWKLRDGRFAPEQSLRRRRHMRGYGHGSADVPVRFAAAGISELSNGARPGPSSVFRCYCFSGGCDVRGVPSGSCRSVFPACMKEGISRFASSGSRNLTSSSPWLGNPYN